MEKGKVMEYLAERITDAVMKGAPKEQIEEMIKQSAEIIDETKADMDYTARSLVAAYALNHLDKSDPTITFDTYIVWKVKVLQNWKYLISTSLYDGMYYELTYNGDKKEWYLDAYKKFENKVITDEHTK